MEIRQRKRQVGGMTTGGILVSCLYCSACRQCWWGWQQRFPVSVYCCLLGCLFGVVQGPGGTTMACRHQGSGNGDSREGSLSDQSAHQQCPSPVIQHLKRVQSRWVTFRTLTHQYTSTSACLGPRTAYVLYKLKLWLTLGFPAFAAFRELFGLLVRCFVEKLSCVLMSCWCRVTSSPKGDNPGALPFADRCLPGLEITDLFGRLRYKELSSHLLLHSTEQGTCISGQLIVFLALTLLLPIPVSSRKKNRRILSEDPCRLSHFLFPLIYCSQTLSGVNWTLSCWGGLV